MTECTKFHTIRLVFRDGHLVTKGIRCVDCGKYLGKVKHEKSIRK